MYDKTIDSSNKIISSDSLKEIIVMMNDILTKYKAISVAEKQKNEMLNYDEQIFTFKDSDSSLHFSVNFYDDTNSKIDNYDEFIYVFENRLREIKDFSVYFSLNYSKTVFDPNRTNKYINQSISMYIYENSIDINTRLSSDDNILDELYEKIRQMILTAPERYDKVIKNKSMMSLLFGLSVGLIPSTILVTLLLVNENIRELFMKTFAIYPVLCVVLGFIIGTVISQIMFEPNYKTISPKKKYSGYKDGKAVYVDDVEEFKKKSEVLIGKNANNLEYRKKILSLYNKFIKFIPISLIAIMLITVILVIMGK